MTKWEEFSSDDLWQIRNKVKYKYDRALILTLAFSIPLFFVCPYIPGKRGGPLIKTMSYWDAVLTFMIFWLILLIIVVIYNNIRAKRDYERIKQNLNPKIQKDVINRIQTIFLDLDYRRIFFRSIGNYIIDKNLLNDLNQGDTAEIRIEINSGAVLSIKKLPPT